MTQDSIPVTEIHIGSNIYTCDGDKIGQLKFLAVDPESHMVKDLVLRSFNDNDQDKRVPVSHVGRALPRGIFLSIAKSDVQDLEDFDMSVFASRSHGNHRNNRNNRNRRNNNRNRRNNNRNNNNK